MKKAKYGLTVKAFHITISNVGLYTKRMLKNKGGMELAGF